ncbi:hypothetical protein TCAL_12203, partial [Tigriopus californicus]
IALDRDDPNQTFWTLGEILKIQRSVSNDGKPLTKLRPKEYPSLRPDAMTQMCFSPTNRSIPRQRLIYNRVPKCASSTMQSVITFLGLRNNFDYRASNIFWKRLQSTSEERHWIRAVNQEIQGLQRPLVTDRHFYFVDLEQYGSERVNWINIVRDPIERLISEFYYLRHPKRWMNQSRRPSQTWFNLTFNECLQNGLPECMFHLDGNYLRELQLTYFCGSALECSQVGNLRALQQAKSNLERHYSVVGIMSDLETSLRLPLVTRLIRQRGGLRPPPLLVVVVVEDEAAAAAFGVFSVGGRLSLIVIRNTVMDKRALMPKVTFSPDSEGT